MVVVTGLDGATRTGYDPSRNWVSQLALGPHGWTGVVNLAACGGLLFAYAIGLKLWLPPSQTARRTVWLVLVCAAGFLVIAVVPIDPGLGYPPGIPAVHTPVGYLHQAGAIVLFTSGTLASALLGRCAEDLQPADDHRALPPPTNRPLGHSQAGSHWSKTRLTWNAEARTRQPGNQQAPPTRAETTQPAGCRARTGRSGGPQAGIPRAGTAKGGLVVSGVMTVSFVVACVLVTLDVTAVYEGTPSGLFERVALFTGLGWIGFVGVRLFSLAVERAR